MPMTSAANVEPHQNLDPRIVRCSPICLALAPEFIVRCCNYCLKPNSQSVTLKRCGKCSFVWYCSSVCQKSDWTFMHKLECASLKGNFESWCSFSALGAGSSEFALLMLRTLLKFEAGSLQKIRSEHSPKTFENLLTHSDEIEAVECRVAAFDQFSNYLSTVLLRRSVDRTTLFNIFAKLSINSFTINSYHFEALKAKETSIGNALDLDLASYDHSCRPNAHVYWCGRTPFVIPLRDGVDCRNVPKTFLTYTDLMATKAMRQTDLLANYYFLCQCERCVDPADDFLIALACQQCKQPLLIDEQRMTDDAYKKSIVCASCQLKQPIERIERCCVLMSDINQFVNYTMNELPLSKRRREIVRLAQSAKTLLPICNLFHALIQYVAGSVADNLRERAKSWLLHLEVMKKCHPPGYSGKLITEQVRTCHALLAEGMFDEAKPILTDLKSACDAYFVIDASPIEARLKYLCECLASAQRTCDVGQWENAGMPFEVAVVGSSI